MIDVDGIDASVLIRLMHCAEIPDLFLPLKFKVLSASTLGRLVSALLTEP